MAVRPNTRCSITMPVDVDGELLAGFFSELAGLLSERPEAVNIDCSLLDHVSSSHVNVLWEAQARCEEAGVALRLCFVTYGLHRVLKVLDLDGFFLIDEPSLEHAEKQEQAPARGRAWPTFNFALRPTLAEIDLASERLRAFLVELRVPSLCAFDLQTVFYEVMTNIRRHGGLDRSDAVTVTVTPAPNTVVVSFLDSGRRFDPTSPVHHFDPGLAIKKRQRNGIGLSLIRRLANRVRYQRINDRENVLTIEKDFE